MVIVRDELKDILYGQILEGIFEVEKPNYFLGVNTLEDLASCVWVFESIIETNLKVSYEVQSFIQFQHK